VRFHFPFCLLSNKKKNEENRKSKRSGGGSSREQAGSNKEKAKAHGSSMAGGGKECSLVWRVAFLSASMRSPHQFKPKISPPYFLFHKIGKGFCLYPPAPAGVPILNFVVVAVRGSTADQSTCDVFVSSVPIGWEVSEGKTVWLEHMPWFMRECVSGCSAGCGIQDA